MENHFSSWALS